MKKALIAILSLLIIFPSYTIKASENNGKKAVAGISIAALCVGVTYLAWTWSDQAKKENDALFKEQINQTKEKIKLLEEQGQHENNKLNPFPDNKQNQNTTHLDQQEQQPETEPKSSPTGDLLRALDEHKKVNSQQTKDLIQKVEDQTKDIIQKIEEIGKRIDEISKVEEMQAKRQGQCEALLKALQNSFDHNY